MNLCSFFDHSHKLHSKGSVPMVWLSFHSHWTTATMTRRNLSIRCPHVCMEWFVLIGVHNSMQPVVRNVYGNCYRLRASNVQLLCNRALPNWPDCFYVNFEFHLTAPMQIHLECLYNDPTKIDPRMYHHSHLFAIQPNREIFIGKLISM